MIRTHVSTPSAAACRARRLTGSVRRSAQSYCWESRARPAKTPSRPGPGSTSAAVRPPAAPSEGISSGPLAGRHRRPVRSPAALPPRSRRHVASLRGGSPIPPGAVHTSHGSMSSASRVARSSAPSRVTGPGARQLAVVPPVHPLDVAGGGDQEDLVGAASTSIGSSTSTHVVPLEHQRPGDAGQAAGGERRRAQLAADDVEDVGAGALAEVAGQVGEDRLGRAPASAASASATTFSAYDVDFSPASAPRSLRGHGTVTTAVVSRRRLHRRRDHDQRRRRVAPAGAERRRPAGVGDPDAARAAACSAVEHRGHARGVRGRRRGPAGRARRPTGASRSRWRVSANGWPSTTLIASNTPSPTVRPWSVTPMAGASGSSSSWPLTQACMRPTLALP